MSDNNMKLFTEVKEKHMKCLFCHEQIEDFDHKPIAYLIISKFRESENDVKIHVHGNIEDKENMIDMVDALLRETHLEDYFIKNKAIGAE